MKKIKIFLEEIIFLEIWIYWIMENIGIEC